MNHSCLSRLAGVTQGGEKLALGGGRGIKTKHLAFIVEKSSGQEDPKRLLVRRCRREQLGRRWKLRIERELGEVSTSRGVGRFSREEHTRDGRRT